MESKTIYLSDNEFKAVICPSGNAIFYGKECTTMDREDVLILRDWLNKYYPEQTKEQIRHEINELLKDYPEKHPEQWAAFKKINGNLD